MKILIILLTSLWILIISCKNCGESKEGTPVSTVTTNETKFGTFTLEENGRDLVLNEYLTIKSFDTKDGNIRYILFVEGKSTDFDTYHTAHGSVDEIVSFLVSEYDNKFKGFNKPFKYD